ncbi:hypothetical protein K438DRAFT_2011954 [Mycena galopus ATCC 62051]|nr:hypothetical protein K438DRAFT_2011954 [Mycena galopus ATCC 62051]
MKRGAERQITKDSDEPEEEELSGDAAFHKADDAVLATRKIKAMPRRLGGSPSLPGSPSDSAANRAENPGTPPLTKFSSFSGFGTPGNGSTGFSFVPPSSSPSFPPANSTSSTFGATPGTPTPAPLFTSLPPAVAPTASNAAKTLSSFLGGASSKPAAGAAPPPSQQDGDAAEEAELKYYSSLRGLNVSILAAITSAIEADPFIDITSLLNRYSSLRLDVQKEYDGHVKSDAPARSSAPSPSPFGAPPTPQPFSAPAAPLKMPAPPASFAGFGKPAAEPAPKTNGAADPPSANPPANPFAFPSSTSASSSSSTALKPSFFGPSATTTSSAFGAPAPSTSLFGSGATTSPFGGATATSSPFGSPSPFSAGSKPAATSLFGSGSGSAFGSSSSATPPASPFGGFGGKGSIGNPVGFSFASPKADADKEKESGEKKAEEGDGDGDTEAATSQETEKATTSDEGSATSSGLLFGDDAPTGLDAEGEGEEDEETLHQAKVKAYRLRKENESEKGWLDIGTGFTRLKKHKETSARRILLRNSAGKIQINFALYSGLKASQSKKSLTFVGHDTAGESQTYSLRFRSEDAAKEFQIAMEKEIAEIKSS